MKILFFLLATFVSSCLVSQTFNVSDPIQIPSAYGNAHPQIEITNDGLPAIIWTSGSLKNIYFAKHDGINNFNTPVQVNPSGLTAQSYTWSGPDLSVWQDNVYLTFKQYGYSTGGIYLVKSADNGVTWGDTVRVDDTPGFGNYPDVAVYNDTVWVTFMDHDVSGLNPQYRVARSVDGGVTFEPDVLASELTSAEACDCCQPEIVANNKTVVVYFRNNDANIRDIKGVISYDRGATFTSIVSPDDHLWNIMACPSTGPDARYLSSDTVVTVYKTEELGTAKIFMDKSDIASATSISTIEISSFSGTNPNYPQIAIDNNNIGIVWEAVDSFGDIFFLGSNSGWNGLNPANTINITDSAGSQVKPDIAYYNGVFHLAYSEGSLGGVKYVRVGETVGISEEVNPAFNFYPNPAQDNLHIQFDAETLEKAEIEVYDVTGKMLYSKKVQISKGANTLSLNIESLAIGSYVLRMSINGKTGARNFIKN